MKKEAYVISIFLISILLAACSGNNAAKNTLKQGTVANENYQELPLCVTENGIYYNQATDFSPLGVHYVDYSTGKDVLLCAKPECRHDGNEFCAATNSKYTPIRFQIYDDALYLGAICTEDDSFSIKLVKIALDGSSLEEIATFFAGTLPANSDPTRYLDKDAVILHRGKALFHVCISGDDQIEDTLFYGTAIYDLNTGETKYLNDKPISSDNPALTKISAHGDAFYFIIMDGKKRILHRYHMTEDMDEPLSLLMNFTGEYVVMDNGNVYYLRTMNKNLSILYTDGVNGDLGNLQVTTDLYLIEDSLPSFIKKEWITQQTYQTSNQYKPECEVVATSLQTDGKFLYVFASKPNDVYGQFTFTLPKEHADLMYYTDPENGDGLRIVNEDARLVYYPTMRYGLSEYQQTLIVYDAIAQRRELLFPEIVPPTKSEGISNGYEFHPYVVQDKIYFELCEIHDYNITKKHYLSEDLSAFLEGTPFPEPIISLDPN